MREDAPAKLPERLKPILTWRSKMPWLLFPFVEEDFSVRQFNEAVAKVNLSISCLERAEQHRKGLTVLKSYEEAEKYTKTSRRLLREAVDTFQAAAINSDSASFCHAIALLLLRKDLVNLNRPFVPGDIFLKSALLGHQPAVEWLIESVAKPTVALIEGMVATGLPFTTETYSSLRKCYVLMNVLAASGRSTEAATFRDRIEAVAGPAFASEIVFAQRESQKLLDELRVQITPWRE